MFNKFFLLVAILTSSLSTKALAYSGEVECSNEHMTFQLVHESNPRNGASSQVIAIIGDSPFGNPWLWKLEQNSGFFVKQQKYRTMMGGILTVAEQVSMVRGGCLIPSCDPVISASYFKNTGEVITYACEAL
jgi:hypothetical protein